VCAEILELRYTYNFNYEGSVRWLPTFGWKKFEIHNISRAVGVNNPMSYNI
jgi:hypothetical protein